MYKHNLDTKVMNPFELRKILSIFNTLQGLFYHFTI